VCAVIDDLRHPSRGDEDQVELLRRLEDRLRRWGRDSAFVLVPPNVDDHLAGPIVCAVDASTSARRALLLAAALAGDVDAPVVVAHAIPFAYADELEEYGAVAARGRRAALHRVSVNVRRVIGERRIEVLSGRLSSQFRLAGFAREQNARLLVIGSRDVAAEPWLSREASCPVVVLSPALAAGTRSRRHRP
jgi:nucleotide-binding universal stress UspA family protein